MKKNIQNHIFVNRAIQTVVVLAALLLFFIRFGVVNAITRSQVAIAPAFTPRAVGHTPRTNTVPTIELTEAVSEEAPVAEQETQPSTQAEEGTDQEVPATSETPVASETPTATAATTSQAAATPAASETPATTPAQSGTDEASAKEFIAQKESGGSYTAQNGRFYGRYQLDISYLNGDLSPENQERVADAYVAGRYGSWVAAKEFWLTHYWY